MSIDCEEGWLNLVGMRTASPEDDKAIELFRRKIQVPEYLDLDSMTVSRAEGLLSVSFNKYHGGELAR